MIKCNEKKLAHQTIIDLLIKPNHNINSILNNILFDESIVCFDTIGNIDSSRLKKGISIISYHWINNYSQFQRIIDQISFDKPCTFIVDSITFIYDENPKLIRKCINLLWKVIYKNKCTIILVNHYWLKFSHNQRIFFPSMNSFYFDFVSYQIIVETIENQKRNLFHLIENKKHLLLTKQ